MRRPSLVLSSVLLCLVALPSPAWAEDDEIAGFHAAVDAGVRLQPSGARVLTDVGYRFSLFDSAHRLLEDTYVDVGVTANASPVSLWVGPYVEVLPAQVLKLRASVQPMGYFGSFGHLTEVSRDRRGRFEISVLDEGRGITAGEASLGLLARFSATPRIKWGHFVALCETTFGYIRMEEVDATYYEPMLDAVFAPSDTFWMIEPTAGFVIDLGEARGSLFYGLRLEHTASVDTDFENNLYLGVLRWTTPAQWDLWGSPEVTVGAGGWLTHSQRRGDPYIAVDAGVEWPAKRGK